jgi:hypothetical protein
MTMTNLILLGIVPAALVVLAGMLVRRVSGRRFLHCLLALCVALLLAPGIAIGTRVGVAYVLQYLYLEVEQGELDPLLTGSTFGALRSLAQWLVLRRPFERAHAWVLANMLVWPGLHASQLA